MQTYNTHTLLQQLQQQTESFLDTAIKEWQLLPHSTFAKAPAANSWSALQCLEHLNSYGRYYLPAIENGLLKNQQFSPNDTYKPGWLGDYFTKLMQPAANGRPVKKMKAPKAHIPANSRPAHEVIGEFIDQQEQMLHLLRMAEKFNLQKIRVPISIARFIRLQLGDVFRFMVAHHHRHVLQATRALSQAVVYR